MKTYGFHRILTHFWLPSGAQLDHQACRIVLGKSRISPGFHQAKSEFHQENLGIDPRKFIFSSKKDDGLVYDFIIV